MAQSGYVPGAAQHAPLLSKYAIQLTETPPENFVGNLILPDDQVASFLGIAPVRNNEEFEVDDDDLIGDKTDFREVQFSEGETSWELGMHGRKAVIGAHSIAKAKQAARMAGAGDPLYDLEKRVTALLAAQNTRRNELLRMRVILNPDNYPASNVFGADEIGAATLVVDTADNVRQVLKKAAKQVESAGNGPANLVVIGAVAADGLDMNTNLGDLMADNSDKIVTREFIKSIMRMPDDARVEFATATYRTRANAPLTYMMDNWIWVGRVSTAPDGKPAFGWNKWMPCDENGQRIYSNRLLVGVQENRHIGLKNYYLPSIEDGSLGVLIPTSLSA